jgi:hypothetical protein
MSREYLDHCWQDGELRCSRFSRKSGKRCILSKHRWWTVCRFVPRWALDASIYASKGRLSPMVPEKRPRTRKP